MAKKFLRYALVALMLIGYTSASAAFKGFTIDFRSTDLVPAEEQVQWGAVEFGVVIAEDGTLSRVAVDDASADIVLSGKYHGVDHGWSGFNAKLAVDGPVKISVGGCQFASGNVTVKNANGEVVSEFAGSTGACYRGDESAIAYGYYKGEAGAIEVSFGSYAHTLSIVPVDPSEIVEEVEVKFSLGECGAEGQLPKDFKVETGSKFKLPANFTLYLEGQTLTGWNDGTTNYAPGTEITASEAMTFTPVFAENAVSLDDRTEAVTLVWDFQQKNGAPVVAWERNGVHPFVAQATIGDQVIDVKIDVDVTAGKFNNASNQDWIQINGGTVITIPSCKGAVVSIEAYNNLTDLTIDGQKDYASGKTISYTVQNEASNVDIVFASEGSYYRTVSVVLPVVESAERTFKGFAIDFRSTDLVLAEEQVQWGEVKFGIVIAEDGTLSRVAHNDETADVVLSGKYHGTDHGWSGFKAILTVDGPVKIGVGGCQFASGNVTVKNANGEVVSEFAGSTGACYRGDESAIAYGYYKGEAGAIEVSFGSYAHTLSIVPVDPSEIVEDVDIKFSLGETGAVGQLPKDFKAETGGKFKLPANYTLYLEGHTLTGWNDGTTNYAPGTEITVAEAMTFTPVFAANTVSLDDRTEAVTIKWDFQQKNGAPVVAWERNGVHPFVAQATIGDQVIDVKIDVDVTAGKFNNASNQDWIQINGGTVITIPSCKGAVVSIEAYNNLTDLTIDGQKDYASGKTISYTVQNEASNVDIVFASEGSYYRYVQVVLPYIAPAAGGTEYENEEASVIWPFNSDNYAGNYTATPAGDFGFQLVTVAIEGGSYVGTSTCSEMDGKSNGVTFVKVQPEATGVNTVWTVKPAAGLTFTPTKVSLHLCKFGTDAGKVAYPLMAKTEDGASVNLGSYVPCRNNTVGTGDASYNETNWTSYIEVELTAEQQAQLATTGAFSISMNMDNLANNKQGGFSDVRIYGLLNGKIQEVSKYAVTVAAEPAEGGSVSIYPNVAEFNEGSEVKVTATENFGYNFVNWTDADGNEVSVEPVFTLAVDKAYDLTANFVAVETYELAYAVEGGANLYMVNPTPAPTVVEGKNMYEDGTTVSLVASSNPILTFTNWSDGQTSGEISLIMSQDYSYTASYTAADYIVGWDFYLAGGSGRPADFAAADNDAVSLVLRTDDGQTSGWLDKSQMAAGGYEGRPGAVNWRTGSAEGDVGHYYFQTKFNASAFTNVVMQTSSVYNFNSYTNFFIQYSLDGENWTTIGNLAMQGAKSWCDTTVEFPEECNNKAEVYVRWYPDRDSAIDGTASANDGFCLGATYVTGTPQLVDDGTAPVLVTTVPAEGADNASASGKVVLTFDEKVKVAEGTTATLGELSLKPFVSGKVVTFEYKGLDYVTDYTFTLKAGSVMDLTDNAIEEDIVINFTTKNRPEIAKGAYDFIVPDDGNFREAINAANSRADKSARYRIFVRQGAHVSPAEGEMAGTGSYEGNTYPDPRLDLTTNNVSIIGEGLEVTSIVNECPDVASGGTNPIEGLRYAYTLHNTGTGTYIEDIKLINDLSDATGRGEAYEESGDKTILKGVGLWGYQDTYCSNNGSGRYYVEGGVIRGRTDYICGKDDIFFNGVEFRNVGKGGYIAVPSSPRQYGWILRDCRVTAENPDETNGTFTLGRPWGNGTPIALWINTVCEVLPSAAGWAEMSGGWPARFAEYNTTTATGTTVDLSDRKTTFGDGHVNNPILTADEAAFYTVQNVLGGDDDWDPTAATEDAPGPDRVDLSEAGVMTWEDSPYVLLWAICKDGVVIDFTIEPTYTVDDLDAKYSVRPANEMGGLGEPVEAQKTVGIINVETGAEVISTVTYNMQGQRVANNYRGASLRVETLSDGTVRTVKSME